MILLEENLEILEMNEVEKMSYELIEEKEKVKFDFDNWVLSSFLVITVLSTGIIIFIFIAKKMLFEHLLVYSIFGVFLSFSLALIFTFVLEFSLKIKRKRKLKNDREYHLAKEIVRNYEKKVSEFNKKKFFENKRKDCKEVLDKEVEKSKRISKLENYLRNERKRNEEE